MCALRPTLVLLLLLHAGAAAAQAPPPRWNVLYIVSDDLNTSLGCYGNPVVRSPNIDRLAERGMRFERAYCNYPVCNPSRTSFLSGLRPETTRILDNRTPPRVTLPDAVFLPEFFRRHGYRTAKVGKIFHTGDEFEDPRSWDVDVREQRRAKSPPESQILHVQTDGGIVLRADDADTWEGYVARKTVDLLEDAAGRDQPFFIAAGFRMPHRPYTAPERYHAIYRPEEIQPRVGPAAGLARVPDLALTYRIGVNNPFPHERPGETIAAYYAAISFMDAQVGLLLDALDRLGILDRTIVVFHSDHGYHLGEHGGLWHKLSLFDEGVRIPLIIAAPGRRPGCCNRLVEAVDLYPTLAELCGLAPPPELEGTSLVPLLDHPARPWKTAVFAEVARPGGDSADDPKIGGRDTLGRTVFDGRWRYTEWHDGSAELYDHHHDPFEYDNVADDPGHRPRRDGLREVLAAGWRSTVPSPAR